MTSQFTLRGDTAATLRNSQALKHDGVAAGDALSIVLTAKMPALSAAIVTGEAITMALTAPMPVIEIGTKDFLLTAPMPSMAMEIQAGTVITMALTAPMPLLVVSGTSPAIITMALIAPMPRASIVVAAGHIMTMALTARMPRATITGASGNLCTMALTAVMPALAIAGYPAFTITMALTAPMPRLSAELSAAVLAAFRTWVMNLRKGALTEYGSEWAFNSYARFNGVDLACGANGVSVLGTQDTDAGTAITGRFRTGKNDYDVSYLKRIPRIYIDGKAQGDALFRTITAENGTRTYSLPWNQATGLTQRRVPVGRGPKSRSWSLEYENVGGADFAVSSIMVKPEATRRRVQ